MAALIRGAPATLSGDAPWLAPLPRPRHPPPRLDGEMDEYAESAFYMKGSIDQVIEQGKSSGN